MSQWYAIVDGAADPKLYDLIVGSSDQVCLYRDEYDAQTRPSLPYLVELREGEPLAEAWRKHESGRFWGIICRSPCDLSALRRHLRKFTTARLPLGDVVLFRFWDPRVFVTFAEKGTAEEIGPFFDKVEVVIADLGPSGRRRFAWDNGLQSSSAAPLEVER